MRVGPLCALIGVIAGIVAGERTSPAVSTPAILLGIAGLAAAWLTHDRVRVLLVTFALMCIGAGVMVRALEGQKVSSLGPGIAARALVTIRGQLTSDPSGPNYSVSALVRVNGAHRTLLVSATGNDADPFRAVDAGDRVVLRGRLAPLRPGGLDDNARWRHAVGRLDNARLLALAPPRGVSSIANRIRAWLLGGTRALEPKPRALTAAFLLGDTRGIPPGLVADYRDSGLSHLLVVSGENVAFVLALAGPFLRRLRLAARTATAVAVIVLFATMTRFEPSVLRASVMAAIALFAGAAGRPASTLRVLAYAIIVLLLVDPFLVHSTGFALSCAASAGIGLLSAPIGARLPGPRALRDPLAVSIGAQIGVLPVLLWAFGTFPLVAPLTNLLAAPAAEALGVYGCAASAVAATVPRLGPLAQQPTALLVAWVNAVAHAGAAYPVKVDGRDALGLLGLFAAIASVACLRARPAVPDPAPRRAPP